MFTALRLPVESLGEGKTRPQFSQSVSLLVGNIWIAFTQDFFIYYLLLLGGVTSLSYHIYQQILSYFQLVYKSWKQDLVVCDVSVP